LLDWRFMRVFLLHMTRSRGWLFRMHLSKIHIMFFGCWSQMFLLNFDTEWMNEIRVLRLQKSHKYCLLGQLSSEVGWNYYDTMKVGFYCFVLKKILCIL
jgi:galactitol-specific phosphotransferase system IIC component